MSREWKPGDVVQVGEEIALRVATGELSGSPAFIFATGGESQYADARPLVVIDPESIKQADRLAELYWSPSTIGKASRDRMQAALRKFAEPTPPKPEEPTRLGAVVEDSKGHRWLVVGGPQRFSDEWYSPDLNTRARWADIDAVKVLSEGVTP